MNFKPILLKSIISVISGIIIDLMLVANSGIECLPPCPQLTFIQKLIRFAFDPLHIIVSLITIVIVYLIWSLFQKK